MMESAIDVELTPVCVRKATANLAYALPQVAVQLGRLCRCVLTRCQSRFVGHCLCDLYFHSNALDPSRAPRNRALMTVPSRIGT